MFQKTLGHTPFRFLVDVTADSSM